jgi:Mycothiol maleylpyruvate isomerase N-terminal domain
MPLKQELLDVERGRWREFRDLVDRIPPDRMEDPTLNAEGWSVKDLLWHIRCWNAVVADELEKIEAGAFEDFDWNTEENNERFLAEGDVWTRSTFRPSSSSLATTPCARWPR